MNQDRSADSAATVTDQSESSVQWLRRLVLVEPGELTALFWSAAYFFLLLFSTSLLRPVRDAMGIAGVADRRPALFTATLVTMLLANPIYAALVARMPRRKFIPLVYRFFAVSFVLFYGLFIWSGETNRIRIGDAFFVWMSVLNLFATSVFWAFMADLFNSEQGKRLFGFIGVGGTLGAICGPAAAVILTGNHVWKLQPITMLLIAAVTLELTVRCVRKLSRHPGAFESLHNTVILPPREPGRGALEGFGLIVHSRYLLMIALYILIYAMTSTFLYWEVSSYIKHTFPDDAARTSAFASIDLWSQSLTLLTQIFLTGRIIRLLGVGMTLALLPAITLIGFMALLRYPLLTIVVVFQVVRRATHFAVDRPSREVLFTVLGPDAKYKSKSFIDTFVYRGGDQLGIWSASALAHFNIAVGTVALPLALAWMATGLWLGFAHQRKARSAIAP